MRKRTPVKLLLAVLLCALPLAAPAGRSQSKDEALLNRRVRNVRLERANLPVALAAFADEYLIPAGAEYTAGGWEGPRVSVNVREGTVRDVLDALIAQDPRYEWKVYDGVVNVVPKAGRDELLEAVLSTEVSRFTVEPGASVSDIKSHIVALPEVKSKLDRAKVVVQLGELRGGEFSPPSPDFALRVSNASVRDILNQIVRSSDVKYWVVNRFGDNNEIFLLNF